MYGSWHMERNRHNFLSFWTFLPFYPPNNPEDQNFEKMKNISEDIILHMCNINGNHIINGSWDMARQTKSNKQKSSCQKVDISRKNWSLHLIFYYFISTYCIIWRTILCFYKSWIIITIPIKIGSKIAGDLKNLQKNCSFKRHNIRHMLLQWCNILMFLSRLHVTKLRSIISWQRTKKEHYGLGYGHTKPAKMSMTKSPLF